MRAMPEEPPSSLLRSEAEAAERLLRQTPWGPVAALVCAIALRIALPQQMRVVPDWLLAALEALLIIALLFGTTGTRRLDDKVVRPLMIVTIALINAANVGSLLLLVRFLLNSGDGVTGKALVLSAVGIWATNVLVFGLWYWELDARGPAYRRANPDVIDGFLFPQMADRNRYSPGWQPAFTDYLYLSFTNSTAFSPTDAMPLTHWAKWLMTLQSLASLVTVALVAARAVNILN